MDTLYLPHNLVIGKSLFKACPEKDGYRLEGSFWCG